MFLRFIFGFIAILLMVDVYGNACTCLSRSREQIYNTSNFVSHVKIVNKVKSVDLDSIVYDVEHLKVFKAKFLQLNHENQTLPLQLFTPLSESTCGVENLIKGDEYVLSGYFQKNGAGLLINICGDVRRVESGQLHFDLSKNETVKIEDDLDLKTLLNL